MKILNDKYGMGLQTGNIQYLYANTNVGTSHILCKVVNNQRLAANLSYTRFVATADTPTTISNLWIILPTTAIDGQEIKITSLLPITSCFVSNGTAGVASVQWLANTWASAGNVSVTCFYDNATSKWIAVK